MCIQKTRKGKKKIRKTHEQDIELWYIPCIQSQSLLVLPQPQFQCIVNSIIIRTLVPIQLSLISYRSHSLHSHTHTHAENVILWPDVRLFCHHIRASNMIYKLILCLCVFFHEFFDRNIFQFVMISFRPFCYMSHSIFSSFE